MDRKSDIEKGGIPMTFEIRNSAGIMLVPAETHLLSSRKIFLEGEIADEMACDFVRNIIFLYRQNKDEPIDVLINSHGGSINAEMLIYDVMQSISDKIRTWCIGKAYSMGAVLFASANKGNRFILPNAEVMIHEPLLGGKIGGNTSSIKAISESLLQIRTKMNQLLSRHTGRSVEEIEEATSYDHYFDSQEAIHFGLCDKVASFQMLIE